MRKLLAIILSLMMLALPVVSLAEGDFISEALANGRMVERTTTFAAMQTGDETTDQIISELLSALSIVTYNQEAGGSQAGLRVNMGGKDILSIDAAGDEEQFWLRSNLLGGDTIVVAPGEIETIADKLLATLVAEGVIDEDAAASAKEQITEALTQSSNPMADVDFEAIAANFDFTALQQLAEELAGKVEEADPSVVPEDAGATKAYTFSMTAEDIVKVYDTIFEAIKGNKEYLALLDTFVVSVNDVPMSAEEAVDTMQEQLSTALPEAIKGEIPVTIYLNDEDELVAASMQMAMVATVNDGEEPQEIAVQANYLRETVGEQVFHQVAYVMGSGEEALGAASLIVATGENTTDAMVTIQADDAMVVFSFQKVETATDTERTADVLMAVSYGPVGAESADTTVMLSVNTDSRKNGQDAEQTTVAMFGMNGNALVTMTTLSKTGDPVESIKNGDVIRLAELSQEDFKSWFESTIVNVQMWALTAIQSLPSSVRTMIMGQ